MTVCVDGTLSAVCKLMVVVPLLPSLAELVIVENWTEGLENTLSKSAAPKIELSCAAVNPVKMIFTMLPPDAYWSDSDPSVKLL